MTSFITIQYVLYCVVLNFCNYRYRQGHFSYFHSRLGKKPPTPSKHRSITLKRTIFTYCCRQYVQHKVILIASTIRVRLHLRISSMSRGPAIRVEKSHRGRTRTPSPPGQPPCAPEIKDNKGHSYKKAAFLCDTYGILYGPNQLKGSLM